MSNENKSGNGWGWFWLIFIIGIVGAGYLFQKEGGKIFGPDGLGRNSYKRVFGIELQATGGNLFEFHYKLKNGSDTELEEVNITITFFREDGAKVLITKYWTSWKTMEEKAFKVPRHSYEKVVLEGTAFRKSEKVIFDSSWTLGK
ncbi:MAG: hypothetical protein QM703_13530 [Gemmatales bacterium]